MRRLILIAALCAVLSVPVMADFGTVELREVSMGPNLTMTIHRAGATADNRAVYVGIQNLNLDQYLSEPIPDIPGYGSLQGNISTFCIDIWDWSSSSYHPYDVVALDAAPDSGAGPMGAVRAARLAEFLDRYWPAGGPLSNIQAAALQAAIWEIVNEAPTMAPGAYDVNAGATQGEFYLTGTGAEKEDARALANTWLHSLSDTGVDFSGYLGLTNPSHFDPCEQVQDYVVRVPVPGAVLLGVLGMGVAGLRLRRRTHV